MRFVGANDSFGEEWALLDRTSPVDAVALADSMIAVIPRRPLLCLLQRHTGFAHSLSRAFADRVIGLLNEFEVSLRQRGIQRLASYLDAVAVPGEAPETWIVRLPVSKTALAARRGVTKETLSRLLRDLADSRLIAAARHEISILNRSGLVEIAG